VYAGRRRIQSSLAIGISVMVTLAAAGPAGAAQAASPLIASPQPGTRDASPNSQISLLGVPISGLGTVTVTGSRSGRHSGRLAPYSQDRGASFLPAKRFTQGEKVTVDVKGSGAATHFDFTIARFAHLKLSKAPTAKSRPGHVTQPLTFASRPDFKVSPLTVTRSSPSTAPGDIFVAPIVQPMATAPFVGQTGPMIVDSQGKLVWSSPLKAPTVALNFHPQTYEGKPVLTWWQGRIVPFGFGSGVIEMLDSSYHEIARLHAGNGYGADIHEAIITPRNTALLTVYSPVITNLSSVGGPHNGVLLDGILQEVDIKTGLVEFEWHNLGRVSLKESYSSAKVNNSSVPLDAFHINSIKELPDGNLLISDRNTWAIYKVDARTGRVMWRLGGKRSSFKLGRGVRFAWQHDAQLQPDGTISLFDDESKPPVGDHSRGLLLRLDTRRHTASLAREFVHPGHKLLAGSQGSTQLLPNGDEFIGWGAEPYLSEFSAGGKLLFDAHFPVPDESYRAFRSPWTGQPTDLPAVAAQKGTGNLKVSVSWNGATEVTSWQVLSGGAPDSLTPSGPAVPRKGFETTIPLPGSAAYVAVRALDGAGKVLATSAAVKPS